ncbi:bifunctional folylpolyglutamate synthase/dihydrofolate synthase [Falsihalocynthiibacter arcticus]|uniref:Dihydrofolate synthase/folylpolyglutamate synthase n=1 Tax=Falsihalocynthiibacter arcticus TaxID=1579316 RepID=A0A126UXN8_9RHOB|nr:folylpolyglutamate synthase/dihydrofolate synthase family protein [Falsihalocynthiibacter arcticus]AML50657.1 bifunctional folylpolyglutamate synthase/dihydrofolate synthase [Falsihalocynthiibacter arcticus]
MSAAASDVILERMMSLHPKIIDLTLDRMERLLAILDHPEQHLPPVVHIAGTNGKGSTQAMIRAGLEGAGKQVHAYTSPHLARFHERIRLAGDLITEDALAAILDECYVANGPESITYFEITTVAALLAFKRTPADFTLLEVGLGGRLDATNVVENPALTVITPVSIDHTQYLGETLAEITGEKAGIIKRGVPCVVGKQDTDALAVIEARAAKLGAPLIAQGQHWHVFEERGRLIFQDETGLLDLPLPTLLGEHQIQNAGVAIASLRALGFDEVACEAAMTKTVWPARMQRLTKGPLSQAAGLNEVWLDGGHNPAAGEAIASLLGTLPAKDTHIICGMLNTKDIAGYLRPLAASVTSFTAVSIPNEANTLPADVTSRVAKDVGMDAEIAPDVQSAIVKIANRSERGRILICGSLYLAGNVLRENG